MNEPRESLLDHPVAAYPLGLSRRVARLLFGVGCGVSITGALFCASSAMPSQPGIKPLLVGTCLLLARALSRRGTRWLLELPGSRRPVSIVGAG
jgi:hypothetical protein